MPESIVFARRQAPDWASLSADFRAGRRIDPKRYVPDHKIPGFPRRIDKIIAAWNERIRIDFFTCRAYIGALSRRSVGAVQGGISLSHDEIPRILALAGTQKFWLFFHDDDDFFAPDMAAWLPPPGQGADCCVFPLFRVHSDLFTFVRDAAPADFVWGRRQAFHFRFQSNNYGIGSDIFSPARLKAMKDHVEASRHADRARLRDVWCAHNVSATVKTPCAASMVHRLVSDPRGYASEISAFAERFATPDLPPAYDWLAAPLRRIAALFAAVAANRDISELPAPEAG